MFAFLVVFHFFPHSGNLQLLCESTSSWMISTEFSAFLEQLGTITLVKWALHHRCFPEHFSYLSGIATGLVLVTKWSHRRCFPQKKFLFFYFFFIFFGAAKAFHFVCKKAPPIFSREYSEFSQNSSFAYQLFGKTILIKFTLKEMLWNLKELVVIIVIITSLQEVVAPHKIWNFSLRVSLVNVTKSAVSCGEEMLNGKLHFLWSTGYRRNNEKILWKVAC